LGVLSAARSTAETRTKHVFAAYLRLNHLAASKAAGGPNTYGKYKQSPGGAGAYRTNKKSSAH
jgi:hypothetical protein